MKYYTRLLSTTKMMKLETTFLELVNNYVYKYVAIAIAGDLNGFVCVYICVCVCWHCSFIILLWVKPQRLNKILLNLCQNTSIHDDDDDDDYWCATLIGHCTVSAKYWTKSFKAFRQSQICGNSLQIPA